MLKKVINNIIIDKGYYDSFKLSNQETNQLYKIIKQSFLEVVSEQNAKSLKILKKINLKDYHKFSELVNHKEIMQKKNRLIKPKNILKIKKMKFFKKLKKIFINFKILNFENLYREEIDWRIVRPNKKDIGPLHRDEWFWTLNKRKVKSNCTRIKVWIPILCEKGLSGLSYVPKSHLIKINLLKKNKRSDGLLKPGLIKKKMNVESFKSDRGQCFIFNDKLMHGGLAGGKFTRVSLEFTILVEDKWLNKYLN